MTSHTMETTSLFCLFGVLPDTKSFVYWLVLPIKWNVCQGKSEGSIKTSKNGHHFTCAYCCYCCWLLTCCYSTFSWVRADLLSLFLLTNNVSVICSYLFSYFTEETMACWTTLCNLWKPPPLDLHSTLLVASCAIFGILWGIQLMLTQRQGERMVIFALCKCFEERNKKIQCVVPPASLLCCCQCGQCAQ